MIINAFQYFGSSNFFLYVKGQISFLWKRKLKVKTERSQEDLDQRMTDFRAQHEKEREKAFLDLIVEIIVQATLKEYYEAKDGVEVYKNR